MSIYRRHSPPIGQFTDVEKLLSKQTNAGQAVYFRKITEHAYVDNLYCKRMN